MIPIAMPHKIYLSTRCVDFRKSHDGLCGEVTNYLGKDPGDGSIFIFFNKSWNKIKLLFFENDGLSTPLAWKMVKDSRLKYRRNSYEREVLLLVSQALQGLGVAVIVLADRGFFDTNFFGFIRDTLQWDYIIRIKQNAKVATETISRREIRTLTASNGRITELTGAQLATKGFIVGSAVTVKAAKMKEAWHLATSFANQKERVVKLYGHRFCCEEHYRDTKDDRFGMELKETHVSTIERRDRFLLFHAIATVLLTLLGAAGEKLGLDRLLRVNTVDRRTHSLYYQGKQYLLGAIHAKFRKLQSCFEALLIEHKSVTDAEWLI
ncbi:MAG: IS66 family insertion sequence element accessory protein TnpB [Chitinivibrionales bacterium]|nr:IS66 family insertion sequence element accessory protein TnpB [Chitinivibrionales bacterium]